MALGRISGEMLEQNLNLTGNLTFNDDVLTIATDGKIGIKNTSPGVELDVTGTARANTLTVLGDLSMEWTISMDAQDTLNFAYNNNLTMSLATDGALLLNGIGLDTIGSGQKVFTASGSISAGDVVRLNNDGTVSFAGLPSIQLSKVLDNPNAYGTPASDYFGRPISISESYTIVGVFFEDDAGGTFSGKAYIYDNSTGDLLYTLDNPNPYGTSQSDNFGHSASISESYAIVGAPYEEGNSGKAYIYDTSTGNLLHTLDNPNDFGTSSGDNFGYSVAISESYAIVVASGEDETSASTAGKAYIFSTSTGNLLHTLDNPNAFGTSSFDNFGFSVAISESYAILGAWGEDELDNSSSGKAYIFSTSTGNLLHTLDNPNPFGTSADDRFGYSVSISESYAIVGAYTEDDDNGTSSGKAYIYDTSTGNLLHTLDNPNAFGTIQSDIFGISVAISESYAIVGAVNEDDAGGTSSGKAYIFSTSTGNLLNTLDNPNAFGTSQSDNFGFSVAISESYAVVGAYAEDDAGGLSSGKAYIYNLTIPSNWLGIAAENIADTATGIIDLPGAINRSQTGLTTNSIYYVDVNGSLTTTPTTFGMIGKAISTTDLQIFGNAVIELSKAIDVDFVTNTPTTTSGLVLTSDGDSTYSFQPADIVRIDSSGNVGIGTSNPTEKLHVSGNIASEDVSVKGNVAIFNENLRDANFNPTSISGPLQTVNQYQSSLTVLSAENAYSILELYSAYGNIEYGKISFGTALGYQNGVYGWFPKEYASITGFSPSGTVVDGGIEFKTTPSLGNLTTRMIITEDGIVSIGSSFLSSNAKLQVGGNISLSGGFDFSSGHNNVQWNIARDASNNLIFSHQGVAKMKLDTSGNLSVVGAVTAFATL